MTRIAHKLIFTTLLASMFWACIKEDDGNPPALNLPNITFSDLTVQEGDIDQTVQLTLTLNGENKTNAVLKFAAVPGTASADQDFMVLTAGQIVFAAGETQKTISIKIIGDEVKEPRESFQLKFYNPINVKLEVDAANITLEDDDDNTAGLTIPSGGYTTPTSYPGYNLVWADEFNAPALNTADWTFEMGDGCPGNCGWGNNELQYYREDNTSIVNGNLVITAKKQNFGNKEYTSSRLITKGKKQFKFGRIDIRE